MPKYTDFDKSCDIVLALFKDQNILLDESIFPLIKNIDRSQVTAILNALKDKHYISEETLNGGSKRYSLLSLGNDILNAGGIKEYYNELNHKEEIKELIDQSVLQTNQSVIDTNTLLQQNIRTQEKLTKTALIIAGLSFFISLATLAKEIWLSSPAIDKETQQIFQKQQLSLDSLKQSLQGIHAVLKSQENISYHKDTTKTK